MSPCLIILKAVFLSYYKHKFSAPSTSKSRERYSLKSKRIMPLISIHSEDIKELKHRKAGPKQQMLVTEIDTVTSILII